MKEASERAWWVRPLTWLAIFAAVMLALSAIVFTGWSEVETVRSDVASTRFADAIDGCGGGPAYVQISPEGTVSVRRELEASEPSNLRTLHLLTFGPGSDRLLHVEFPFWFVRLKTGDTINLGTFVSVLTGDWQNLDLRVAPRDLALRGPGLVLDHTREDGMRIALWTE